MRVFFYFLTFIFFLMLVCPAQAMYDPRSVSNNRFGMHIIDESDLNDAGKLVNSSGGDWGYVKVVIREDDRKVEKWQEIFNRMRQLHLIPIVRIATVTEHGYWRKPRPEDIGSWADFLDQLNWVTENRYVVIFNEPNHAGEWGNELNPEEYAWYLKEYSRKLKEKSEDFFILPAGLDASAESNGGTLDAATFIKRMVAKEPDVFQFIDGWSSHSYPNPGFIGSPNGSGRGTVRTFLWEKELLSSYGVNNLPIFILETGWQHSEGRSRIARYPTPESVGGYLETAFGNAWNNFDVVAVVPFLLNYQDAPFDHFSWKKMNSSEFYPMYDHVKQISKTKGAPKQRHQAIILPATFPQQLVVNSHYTFYVELENTGQSMMSSAEGWRLEVDGFGDDFTFDIGLITEAQPFHRARVMVNFATPAQTQKVPFVLTLYKGDQVISKQETELTLVPPPSLLLQASLWFNQKAEGDDFSVVIYDNEQQLVYSYEKVNFVQGFADVERLLNVVPGRTYRLVLTKPFYLPRQRYVTIGENKTGIVFSPLLPLDPSSDGKLDGADIGAFWKQPLSVLQRLFAW